MLGITRLGRLVAWRGDLGSVSLILVIFVSHFSTVFLYLHRRREADTGEFGGAFFARAISLVTSAPRLMIYASCWLTCDTLRD